MMMLWAVPKVSVTKKWNQRTVGQLISYSNDSESVNPPPDLPLTLHSYLTSILRLHGHLTSFLCLHSHLMPILSLHGHLKSTLPLQTGSLLSLPCVTPPKLVFNPETKQCFCVNNQLILTLILYVLGSQTHVIRLEPHPSYVKHWCFIDWAIRPA